MNKIIVAICVLILLVCWNCSETSDPTQPVQEKERFASFLEIKTEKSGYSMSADFSNSFALVLGTLKNTSQDTFYSRLGDNFNGGIDQDNLYIAKSTGGYFEKHVGGDTWENSEQALLTEGANVVRILPSKIYTFHASAYLDSNSAGIYRLKVIYYTSDVQTTADVFGDTSNTFYIVK